MTISISRESNEENKPGKSEDAVNHPAHYTQGNIECIEAIVAAGFGEGYCRGSAIKYLWRANHKGREVEDLEKANWYVAKAIELATQKRSTKR